MSKNDILVSTNPYLTWIFIRKPEYFLRQISWDDKGRFNGKFRPFDYKVNQKWDMKMVDTLKNLESLRDNANRVWIITDNKLRLFTSPELIEFMENILYEGLHIIEKTGN